MTTAYLMVRATVAQPDRDAFDRWYQTEHLPDAKTAFNALSASRGWVDDGAGLHIAFYEFESLASAQAIVSSDALKSMVAEFDRVWQGRVSRTREVVEITQQI